jgi:hypothetical protein
LAVTTIEILRHGRRLRRGVAILRTANFSSKETAKLLRITEEACEYHCHVLTAKLKTDAWWQISERLLRGGLEQIG